MSLEKDILFYSKENIMNLPTSVSELFKTVNNLNSQGNDFLYFEYAYKLYLDNGKDINFLAFLKDFSLDIAEADISDIAKELDYSDCKWINNPGFELTVTYDSPYFVIGRGLSCSYGFVNDLSNNIIYSVLCHFNDHGFYIEHNDFPYNRKNLTSFMKQQIITNDKLFIKDFHIINLFNLLYCHEIPDKDWLSILKDEKNLRAFFANSLSFMPIEDNDFEYYVHLFNPMGKDELEKVTPEDFVINPKFFNKMSGFIYSYFFMAQLEAVGIINIRSRMFQNYDEGRYSLNNSQVIHYYDKDIDLNFKNNQISICLVRDNINSFIEQPDLNILIETSYSNEEPFRKIQEIVNIIGRDVENFYNQWNNEKEYFNEISNFLASLIDFNENKKFINVQVIKNGYWCNPPDIKISTDNYSFSCNYDEYKSAILSHIHQFESVLNRNILRNKIKEKDQIKKSVQRI